VLSFFNGDYFMCSIKVLVAEDDNLNRELVCKLLEKFGASCWKAEDGISALDIIQTNQFDIVFLDHNMPGYNGSECAERIREYFRDEKGSRPLIVGVSADEEHEDNSLFDEFLPKPFKLDKLEDIFTRVRKDT